VCEKASERVRGRGRVRGSSRARERERAHARGRLEASEFDSFEEQGVTQGRVVVFMLLNHFRA
jgi:hypothetical protein